MPLPSRGGAVAQTDPGHLQSGGGASQKLLATPARRRRRAGRAGLHGRDPPDLCRRRGRAAGARGRACLRSDRRCRRRRHRQRGGKRPVRRVAAAGGAAAGHRQRAGERDRNAARCARTRSSDRRGDAAAGLARPRRRSPVRRNDRGRVRRRGDRCARTPASNNGSADSPLSGR